jgi:hypothetical protein
LIVPYRAIVPLDVTAQIFWLKNRRPDRWRDVQKHEHGSVDAFARMSDAELRAFLAEEAKALGLVHRTASDNQGRRGQKALRLV